MHYTLIELESPADPLLVPWMELYELAFPPSQRVLAAWILRSLVEIAQGDRRGRHLFAALDGDGKFCGLAHTFEPDDQPLGFLWYLATLPNLRGQGLGAWMYHSLLDRMRPEVKAFIFDLEDPGQLTDPAHRQMALRRANFYTRLGARLIGGITYMQTVGPHIAPVEGWLMAHPLAEISAAEVIDLVQPLMGDVITIHKAPYWQDVSHAIV